MPDLLCFHMHTGEKEWTKLPYPFSRSQDCSYSDEPLTVPQWFLTPSGPMKLALPQMEGSCAGHREDYGHSRTSTCISHRRDEAARILLTVNQKSSCFEGPS